LLRYMQNFESLFKILAEDNSPVIPAGNDKQTVIITLTNAAS
jgi:hypothetical protein